MEYNCFTMFSSTVQHCELAIGTHIGLPSWAPHPPSHSTPLGHQIARSWAPCAVQQLPGSFLFYTWQCIYVNATLLSFLVILPYVSFYMSFYYNCELLMNQNIVSSFQNIFATSVPIPTRTWFLLNNYQRVAQKLLKGWRFNLLCQKMGKGGGLVWQWSVRYTVYLSGDYHFFKCIIEV